MYKIFNNYKFIERRFYMKKILIATHGNLASGAKSTLEFLVGNIVDITCIDAYVDPDENLIDILENYFSKIDADDEVIVFTDIKGGSVNQKIIQYTMKPNIFLITGFNLPILLELAIMDKKITVESLEEMIDICKNQLELIKIDMKRESDDDFLE